MIEHKHTPGPWEINKYGQVVDKAGEEVRVHGFTLASRKNETTEANTRLAVAAPELLDALRELVACKRMKEQIAIQQGLVIETDEDMEEMDRIMSDYARRKPKAWENAALILAKSTGATE